ncbi:MAG: tail fiber protein [Patescibacteria group bacterium]|nr:tail fiber protein [Patescibacteria group bacterium]
MNTTLRKSAGFTPSLDRAPQRVPVFLSEKSDNKQKQAGNASLIVLPRWGERSARLSAGFTLIEVLIYTAILAMIGTLFGGILLNTTQFQTKQTASSEVNQQLDFALQQIQRLVRDSSVIDIDAGSATTTLTLRMQDPVKDPTTIYVANNAVTVKEGTANPLPITSSSVIADTLEFTKISSYPGHDSVSVNLMLSYNTQNPQQEYSNSLTSAIARVSAATFDSDIVPGTDNTYSVGLSATRWKDLFLSDNLTVGNTLTLGNLTSDPTGTTGSLYYNSSTNKFMGYSNAGWAEIGKSYWTLTGTKIQNNQTGSDGSLGSWGSTTVLPYSIGNGGTVTANGYIYQLGGQNSGGAVNYVYYAKVNSDGTIGSWTSTTPLVTAYSTITFVAINGYIYEAGGSLGGGAGSNVVNYAKINTDGSLGSWTSTTVLPSGSYQNFGAAANGYFYVMGGYNGSIRNSIYYAKQNNDGSLGSWHTTSLGNGGSLMSSTAVANGYLYVLGGAGYSGNITTVDYAKLNADGSLTGWYNATSLPVGLSGAETVVANGYMYVLGGGASNGAVATVYYAKINSDGSLGAWNSGTALPAARSGITGIVVNGYIYGIGGSTTNTVYYASAGRVTVAGNLDLVGSTGSSLTEQTSNTTDSVGGSLTAGNIFSAGNLQVTGNTTINGSLLVTGTANIVPPGTVMAYAGSTAPSGWFEANGAAVSRTTYANLYAAIGTSFGSGDGSSTFNLPDLRGEFIRGWNHGASTDPDAASRTTSASGGATGDNVGSYQADELKSHTHSLNGYDLAQALGSAVQQGGYGNPAAVGASSIGYTGGNETRPKNIYLMYIIKY